jgi:hypothetical protein
MIPTAPNTRYEVCATILDRAGEVHTQFYTVEAELKSDIRAILATRYALAEKLKNVLIVSVIELEDEL